MFKITFKKLAKRLNHSKLKGAILLGWIMNLVSPLQYVNDEFLAFVANIQKQLAYNGQTIMLEKMLNDYFPGASPLIFITLVGNSYPRGYEFYIAEDQPNAGFEYYISEGIPVTGFEYFTSEYDNRIDFIVNVPSSLTFDINQMTALVRKYCKMDKNFTINIY